MARWLDDLEARGLSEERGRKEKETHGDAVKSMHHFAGSQVRDKSMGTGRYLIHRSGGGDVEG